MGATQRRDGAASILGTCPRCGAAIPESRVLIRYRTEDGWPRLFAECPACTEPVHPR